MNHRCCFRCCITVSRGAFVASPCDQNPRGGLMATKLRSKVLSLACSRATFLLACGMSAALACSSDGGRRDGDPGSNDPTVVEIETGSIQLPLTTRGASGALYRLRNAVFQ